MQLVDAPVGHVRDEQPSRVRAEIDGRDAHPPRLARRYTGRAPRGGAVR
jgi:hypothetical protein